MPLASGKAKVRVVPVVIPESSNCAFFVASALSASVKLASEIVKLLFCAPKTTAGELIVSAPSEPATAEPRLMFVVDPERPAVAKFTVLVLPEVVAPEE